ncbi:MAG TPA: hypothetical protein PK156_22100 [Polyangium sp.]|nr:hypothetical protein [Polyangium sp.]
MRYTTILTLSLGLGCSASALAIGCSATATGSQFGETTGDNQGGGGAGGTAVASSSSAGPGGGGEGGFSFPMDGGAGGPPEMPGEVFGHSENTLYKLEPYSKQVTVIGDFQGCSSVIDLAIDKDSKIIATTATAIYWIDKTNAKCTRIATGSYPNSLSFVPAGTLDPNEEALVGYEDASYVRINTTTGAKTTLGALGNGYVSSGDIVSVKGGGTYLTVKGNGCGDCLFQVDPKTGSMVKNWGPTGYGKVFGIAFWAGSVYGFTDYGQLFELQFLNGQLIIGGEIPIPGAPADLSFWGAGSTTIAPIIPPPT